MTKNNDAFIRCDRCKYFRGNASVNGFGCARNHKEIERDNLAVGLTRGRCEDYAAASRAQIVAQKYEQPLDKAQLEADRLRATAALNSLLDASEVLSRSLALNNALDITTLDAISSAIVGMTRFVEDIDEVIVTLD